MLWFRYTGEVKGKFIYEVKQKQNKKDLQLDSISLTASLRRDLIVVSAKGSSTLSQVCKLRTSLADSLALRYRGFSSTAFRKASSAIFVHFGGMMRLIEAKTRNTVAMSEPFEKASSKLEGEGGKKGAMKMR